MIAHIKNLRVQTIIGIFDWERKHKQDLLLNIEYEFDSSKAIQTDNIIDTVDYDQLSKKILSEVEKSHYMLIEKLAAHILQIIMSNIKIVSAKVKVEKPQALDNADSVTVIIEERRKR